jgi:hypothetical protein
VTISKVNFSAKGNLDVDNRPHVKRRKIGDKPKYKFYMPQMFHGISCSSTTTLPNPYLIVCIYLSLLNLKFHMAMKKKTILLKLLIAIFAQTAAPLKATLIIY